jgi:putative acetyltransferase
MVEIIIRAESATDVDAIRDVNVRAFRDHPISRQTEHLIVDALRDAGALAVSLVAVRDGRTAGHIAFSPARVGDLQGDWYLLGPVAVLPEFQWQGIGTALVEAGLSELRARDAVGCVLVGDPAFYNRFGFATFTDLAYEGVPHEYVLGLPFGELMPHGVVRAHEAFEIQPEPDPRRG